MAPAIEKKKNFDSTKIIIITSPEKKSLATSIAIGLWLKRMLIQIDIYHHDKFIRKLSHKILLQIYCNKIICFPRKCFHIVFSLPV